MPCRTLRTEHVCRVQYGVRNFGKRRVQFRWRRVRISPLPRPAVAIDASPVVVLAVVPAVAVNASPAVPVAAATAVSVAAGRCRSRGRWPWPWTRRCQGRGDGRVAGRGLRRASVRQPRGDDGRGAAALPRPLWRRGDGGAAALPPALLRRRGAKTARRGRCSLGSSRRRRLQRGAAALPAAPPAAGRRPESRHLLPVAIYLDEFDFAQESHLM